MSNASESGAMAMLKTLIKRAAFHATVAIGGFQRRAGGRFPRYASFCRRAAGYVAYAMAGEPFRAVTASPRTSESPRSQRDRYRSSRSSGGTRTDQM